MTIEEAQDLKTFKLVVIDGKLLTHEIHSQEEIKDHTLLVQFMMSFYTLIYLVLSHLKI